MPKRTRRFLVKSPILVASADQERDLNLDFDLAESTDVHTYLVLGLLRENCLFRVTVLVYEDFPW